MTPTAEQNRTAREREQMARAPRKHMEPADTTIDLSSIGEGVEKAEYMEPAVQAQWMIAWKLFYDADGQYGVPLPVPVNQMFNGANALINMRHPDGQFAWTTVPPERLAPAGTIECIADECGDAHIGGKRKMLRSIPNLIEHVEGFHERAAKVYRKYLDQLADQYALDNPRLQALLKEGALDAPASDDELVRLAERKARRVKEDADGG